MHYLPEPMVFLETPFFVGEVLEHCIQEPLYDVFLGNIKGVLSPEKATVKEYFQNKEHELQEKYAYNADSFS
ncbi:hypothetical protein HPB50_011534 [Hyalomma asiaticum]|uniref:Uncharacterized protein n=1 Tax=Hyalomma asiaticum TaxID=266040 RepID=A0ACB7TDH6_HYAAI|nr:hypothetical protein HPB50_011534 [Hyalomma asiaticum]